MTSARHRSTNRHLRHLFAQSSGVGTESPFAESTNPAVEAAAALAEAYVPHKLPKGFSADEVVSVARKAVADQPLEPRARFIAEAIIMPDLRPAIDVIDGDFTIDHPFWTDYVAGTPAHANFVAALASIGRVELPGSATYPFGGTCFVVGPNLVMTNRHVAQIFATGLGKDNLTFIPAINPGVDFAHEAGGPPGRTISFRRVRMIHPYFDMALIEVDGLDGHPALTIKPVEPNARKPRRIAVIGYPAFDPRNNTDVQNEVFRGLFDVKRFQPGLLNGRRGVDSFGKTLSAACHDSSTLGGNSGSAVIDASSGNVIGLHFAGVYKDSNFAIPGIDMAHDGRIIDAGVNIAGGGDRQAGAWDRWWDRLPRVEAAATDRVQAPPPSGNGFAVPGDAITLTVPVQITVTLGQPGTSGAIVAVGGVASLGGQTPSLERAVEAFEAQAPTGVMRVKSGFNGRTDCLVLATDPESFDAVRAAAPPTFAGFPVEVRYATVDELLGISADLVEAPRAIAYDDARRSGGRFDYDADLAQTMSVIAHVGPERSFAVLKQFIAGAKTNLTSSMYQFFAAHVADAVAERIGAGKIPMRIVLDPATRDPGSGPPKPGEFDRSDTFETWRTADTFTDIYVPKGNGGLVASAYHIKVTVRDHDSVWLSSGNWTRTSQPAPDPQTGLARGNREWHIVLENKALADFYEAHIEADFAQCGELGGSEEAVVALETMVDVPEETFVEAPITLLEPLAIAARPFKVRPILTPDRQGRTYTDPVLKLIKSAQQQLLFQNQYIKIRRDMAGNLGELVNALVERSNAIPDLRIILRAGDVDDDVAELRRRGMDVMRVVRVIANTHTKGIIADGGRVLVGSQNWSEQAVATNRDASLLFDDAEVAGYFRQAFEIDWSRARPAAGTPTEQPVRLAKGPAPPQGYVRVSLEDYRNG